jgi:hypothetical protein
MNTAVGRALVVSLMVPILSGWVACRRSQGGSTGSADARPSGTPASSDWFTDEAHASGLDFVHVNGMSGRFYQPEIMTPGVALFDFDNDGDLDVYLVQGGTLEGQLGSARGYAEAGAEASAIARAGQDRLYRNDLVVAADGTRTLRFTDVTAASGIRPRGYGMGVATGDIDNDGDVDLYLTGLGRNQMFRNNGDRTFSDVSSASGTSDPVSWGVSAAFVDFDRDGRLDLFVGNYLRYSLATHIACVGVSGFPDYCRPSAYRPQPSRLYRNTGDGRFVDVTIESGMARQYGPALGVSTADFDRDGWIDIFVANDEQENQLWINQRDGTFVNTALAAGAALGPSGERKANMGVDAGDFDADGDEDLFITELIGQGSTLYVNDGAGFFEEQSARLGIRRPSLPYTGFGAAWLDYDNDGWLDLMAVNGDVNHNAERVPSSRDLVPLGQRNQLFRNLQGRFEDVTDRAGKVFELIEASRGAAFGDVDNDGDTDVLVGNGAGPVRLLLNRIGSTNHWVGLRLVSAELTGSKGGALRDMVGATVELVGSDGAFVRRRARADGSYASANDPRVLVGLGASAAAPRVRVWWPSGRSADWRAVAVDRYTTLTEGEGTSP